MKGQITFEFMGTVVIALLIFAIFYMFITTQFAEMLPFDNQNYEARFHADAIAEQINYAFTGGDGYYGSFVLPEEIRGKEYAVYYDVSNRVIEVDIIDEGDVDSYGIARFFAPDVVMFDVGPGINHISNSNGTVIVWRI